MKKKTLKNLFVLMILAACMTVWACASNRANLLKDGKVKLECIPSKSYYISHVDVYQNDDKLVLHGNVKRRCHSDTETGHVDITIVTPEGEILEQISTLYKPRIIPTRKMHRRTSYFNVCLSTIPPTGSIVRVVYHRDTKVRNSTFDCGKNMALPDVVI